MDICSYPKCNFETALTWLGKGLCEKHWDWVCKTDKKKVMEKLGKLKEIISNELVQTPVILKESVVDTKVVEEKLTDLDKQIYNLHSFGNTMADIAKKIGRAHV